MSNYLIHYGIPGMKWGVRHDRERVGIPRTSDILKGGVVIKDGPQPTSAPRGSNPRPRPTVPNGAISERPGTGLNGRGPKKVEKMRGLSAETEAEHFRRKIMDDNMYRKDVRDLTALLKDSNLSKANRESYQRSLASLQRKVKSNENRKAIISKANQETRPLYDNWAKQKYGSDQWFEAREKYAKAIDSYGTQYVHAAMKDFGTTKVSDAAISVMKKPGFMDSIPSKSPYLNTDYHSIATPDGRDYDLEPAYEKWKAKHK